ncbi:MAG: 3'-5' exonuclease [Hylemonella sp.]|nr:3'-5' exonuclease [Hylemonella sp.]MDP1936369.1 3'-5' exonuclease [Hylemonella sp.]
MSDPQLDFGFEGPVVPLAPTSKGKAKARTKLAAPKPAAPVLAAAAPAADAESLARQLEGHPDFRVLRRLQPCLQFAPAQGPVRHVVLLDTETTGLDASREKIIELALVRVEVDIETGRPCGAVQVYDGLEDPGMPISAEIEALTGISNDMVRGQRLDETRVAELLAGVDLIVAHNAAFDRPFVEARLPAFAQLPWACSFADIDWKTEGQSSAKLENLALSHGWFYDAHRAEMDCHALLAVLGQTLPKSQQTGLARLLLAGTQTSYRLQATAAPFDAKDLLKARGYRWNAEQRVWQTLLSDEAALQAECDWLRSAVYGGRAARVQLEKLHAGIKYSARAGEVSQRQL